MHEINTDYCNVVIEDRRKMVTEFFYKRHMIRLQRQVRHASVSTAGSVSSTIRRLVRSILIIVRKRAKDKVTPKVKTTNR